MEFGTPPATVRRKGSAKWDNIVKELKDHAKDHPTDFALIGNFSPGVPVQIRKGTYKAFLPEDYQGEPETYMKLHWEVITRVAKNGHPSTRLDGWIRWLG